jgi:hypothetical protein
MNNKNIKNTRRTMEPQNLICNNLIATGQCMLHQHCRFKHISDLEHKMNNISEFNYDNLNLSQPDKNFNWDLSDSNKNMDKQALSMFIYLFNNIAHKNIILKDDSKYSYNTITKRRRLPIFCELSNNK